MIAPSRWRTALVAALVLGALVRGGVVLWSTPWEPHHPDEHILPLEAIALWEGVTPREVGWPGTTMRVALSAALGGEFVWQRGAALWQTRGHPDKTVQLVSDWIGRQFVHPSLLFKTGRAIAVLMGIAQLLLLTYALLQWTGVAGTAVAVAAAALSPLAVSYSQFILADIAGLMFSTAIVGLAAAPNTGSIAAMAALAGFAAASKLHYGLWLVVPLMAAWTTSATIQARIRLVALVLLVGFGVILAAVPWLWTNPALALKEMLGVVGAKLPNNGAAVNVLRNALTMMTALGPIVVAGLAGAAVFDLRALRRLLPLLVVMVAGVAALLSSGVLFERYALVVLPAALVVAAVGWQAWLETPRAGFRIAGAVALLACLAITSVSLARAESIAAETDVDVLVRDWVVAHVASGSRVAVHDEMNVVIPRAAAQLRGCAAFVDTPAAYRAKWAVEGIDSASIADEPMRAMLLNDEMFAAYWCRRELVVHEGQEFYVIRYHDAPRFGAALEREVLDEFARGARERTGGIDVLVTNRNVEVGVQPAQVFETARGRRVIYRKVGTKSD